MRQFRQFKITNVVALKEQNELQNVIHRINWLYESTLDGVDLAIPGIVNLPAPDPENFIESDNVTVEMLKEWVLNILGAEQLVKLDEILDTRLNEVVLDISQ